jgi:inorganic pyrophosphatase
MPVQWKWRDEELSLKSFYQLKADEKKEYVNSIEKIPEHELGSNDLYILKFYSTKKSNFISIDDELDLN